MKRIECTIMVEPRAKGRARLTTIGGHARAYTPKATMKAESNIQSDIRKQVMEFGTFDAKVPLSISATFYRLRPVGLSKKVTMPVTKPDVDNYGKLLMDALNKYVFPDDGQVTTIRFRKRFGSPPRIQVIIQEEEIERIK